MSDSTFPLYYYMKTRSYAPRWHIVRNSEFDPLTWRTVCGAHQSAQDTCITDVRKSPLQVCNNCRNQATINQGGLKLS